MKIKSTIKKNITIIIISLVVSVMVFIILASSLFYLLANHGILNKFLTDEKLDSQEHIPLARNSAAEESLVVSAAEKADPAVVSIIITKDVPVIEQYYEEFNPFGNDFFNNFFGNNGLGFRVPRQRQNGTQKREVGGGSGFFISTDGLLVTNRHVVSDKDAEYTVLTNNGKKYDAKVLARDSVLDIAILKVKSKGKNFAYLEFGDSDVLKPGQTVIAIGNALAEFRNSVSVGVVSGLSRSIVAGDFSGNSEFLEGIIQTDAAINPGNSGGPLLDLGGRVIGVNVAVERGAENIGFALAGNAVKTIVDSVKKYGKIIRPYIGIRYLRVTKSLQEKNSLPVDYGVIVARGKNLEDLAVIPGSPADKAGIVENDIILEVDGIKLDAEKSLAQLVRQKSIGQKVKLKILHKGKEKELELKLGKAPSDL